MTLAGTLWNRIASFVRAKAKDMHAGDLTEDLEQECYFALLDAVERFDPSQGIKFLSYAGPCFRGWMQSYLERKCGMHVIPSYLLGRIRKYKRFVSAFQQEHGREPSGAEIMSACSWSREELEKVMMYRNADTITSLDEPFTDEDGERTLADTISSGADPAEEVGEEIFRDQLKRDLWGTVDALPDDQARALRMHYQGQRTFQEIGAELGTSEADGRTICAKGLRALRSDRDTRRKLGPYYVDIYGMAMRGGLNSFMSSRTSATERAALIDLGEWWKK